MRAVMLATVAMGAVGCVSVEHNFTESFDAEGVFFYQGTTDRGMITYDGGALGETFDIRGRSWGNGSGKNRAERREQGNQYLIEVREDTLVTSATSLDRQAGVDFDVLGPSFMNVDILTERGTAQLFDVEGSHVVTANRIFARNVIGDADFYADGTGIDVEVFPYADGVVLIESVGGDVDVFLPWGLDYDLTVVGDVDYVVEIGDLGLDTLVFDAALAVGWRGSRAVRVDVIVTGGDVRVLRAF